jgi:hypothetical protein
MLKARTILLVAAIGTAAVLSLPATAQNRDWNNQNRWGWQDRDHDRNDHDRNDRGHGNQNRDAYRDGYQDAQHDRASNGRYHPRGNRWKGNDRGAYESGYRSGFNGRGQYGYGNRDRDGDRDRDRDRDGRRGGNYGYGNRGYGNGEYGYGNGGYGNGGYGNGNYGYGRRGGPAAQFGYQDGLSYGQRDASRGKGFNATGSYYYEHADHGYNSSYGDRNGYRQAYRQAYQQGYQAGYYGRGGRRY